MPNAYKLFIDVPLTSTSGKVRVKERNMLYEYGLPVATRTVPFAQNHYIEWQIGYDVIVADKKKILLTSLPDLNFIGANGKKKALFELSEYIHHLFINGVIGLEELMMLHEDVVSIDDCDLLDSSLRIKRGNPIQKSYNGVNFDESTVEYPLLVRKFDEFEIVAEIITKEKQYAVGIMPMLYFCFPITKLVTDEALIGRTARVKEIAQLVFDKTNSSVLLEILRLFGMLSPAHKHDTLAILNVIIENL